MGLPLPLGFRDFITASAKLRSSFVVILKLNAEPGTTLTAWPSASINCESSVIAAPNSARREYPSTIQSRRKTCGVWASHRLSRGSVAVIFWFSTRFKQLTGLSPARYLMRYRLERDRELLLSTGDATLVEHTENDSYWGDGGDGSGKSMLGRVLMEVRDELRRQQQER